MKSMCHREYLARLKYIEEQWDEPSRSDYYLMQIAAEVRSVLRKNIPALDMFKVTFEWAGKKVKMSRQQAALWAKSKWIGIVGSTGGTKETGKPTVIRKKLTKKDPD